VRGVIGEGMDRRGFLASAAAFAALAGPARAGVDGLRLAAREAWLYGLPLIQMAAVRTRMVGGGAAAPGLNSFVHARELATPRSRVVTTPNRDTLYSSAWLDLTSGSAKISLPPTGQRYFSLALIDMYTNNIRVISGRDNEGEGGDYEVIGPNRPIDFHDIELPRLRLPRLGHPIRATTPWVWALARTQVGGDDDLAVVHGIQDGLTVEVSRPARAPAAYPGPDAPWGDYLFAVQQLIQENPAPFDEAEFFHRIAAIQLGARRGFEQARFADSETPDVEAGVREARALAAEPQACGQVVNGWIYPKPNLGAFGADYVYRAGTAMTGLGALPRTEAVYLRALAADGTGLFDSAGQYRLTMPGPPPADAFWSLTLYEAAPDGRLFLTDNPINRYSIGDRTTGLRWSPRGALDIWIGQPDPGGAHTSNWLPAPAQGKFALVLRAYLPKRDLLDGHYRLPPVRDLNGPPPHKRD